MLRRRAFLEQTLKAWVGTVVDRRERLQFRDELHFTVRLYQRIDGELHEIGPQAEDHWSALPYLLDDWRMTESAYCRAAGLEDPYITNLQNVRGLHRFFMVFMPLRLLAELSRV